MFKSCRPVQLGARDRGGGSALLASERRAKVVLATLPRRVVRLSVAYSVDSRSSSLLDPFSCSYVCTSYRGAVTNLEK